MKATRDLIPGGLADEGPPADLDPGQVEKGIRVEMEHTDDPDIAREIAWDHLAEDSRYYDKLEKMEAKEARVARRWVEANAHRKSVALMKFLSKFARSLGPKVSENVYVVGGAVRDFVLDRPIKDVDLVVDSSELGRDSEWFADQLAYRIPAATRKTTNHYGVVILHVAGSWILDGFQMEHEQIEIANARTESYGEGGYKPTDVQPSNIEDDVYRRELTYNTLLISLANLANGPDKKDILDLTGCGLDDLAAGIMKCPADPDKVFKDDPSRMIRVIKFALRYGHELTPDTRAAILRNATKIKNIPPGAIRDLLEGVILQDRWKEGLKWMADLRILEPARDHLQSDPEQIKGLMTHLRGSRLEMLFDLMDVGFVVEKDVDFLSRAEQARLREIVVGMDAAESWEFQAALKSPGRAFKDKKFIPELAAELGYSRKQMREFGPLVQEAARDLLLGDPGLLDNPARLRDLVRRRIESARRASVRVAVPEKYRDIDFKPPELVAKAAEKGLEYRRKSGKGGITNEEAGKAGIGSGVQRAVNLKNRDNASPEVIGKMLGFFARHEKNKDIAEENKGKPWEDAGYVAWLLWGGDAGLAWARKVKKQMDAADEKAKTAGRLRGKWWKSLSPGDYIDLRTAQGWVSYQIKDMTSRRVWVDIEGERRSFMWGNDGLMRPSTPRMAYGQGDGGEKTATLAEAWGPTLFEKTAAETGDGTGVGLFIPLPEELAKQFPVKEEDPSPQHVTFLYIGDVPKEREQELLGVLENLFLDIGTVRAALDGMGSFQTQTSKVVYSKVRFSEDMDHLRALVWKALDEAGFEVEDSWQMYQPHSTIAYLDDPFKVWEGQAPQGTWEFNSIEIWGLPKKYVVPFGEPVRLRDPLPEIGIQRVARILDQRGLLSIQDYEATLGSKR